MIIRATDALYTRLVQEFFKERQPAHFTCMGKCWQVVTDNDERYFVEVAQPGLDETGNSR